MVVREERSVGVDAKGSRIGIEETRGRVGRGEARVGQKTGRLV